MSTRITLVAAACALALSACGNRNAPSGEETATPAATPAETAPPTTTPETGATTPETGMTPPAATTEPGTMAPAPAAAAGGEKPAATVSDCATTIEGNDAMQYNVGSITVPASCTKFTINLKHPGTMPVTAMGHNVVITKASDMQAVAADGLAAGATNSYVKPGDTRVIAHTDLVGGGQSTSVSFDVSKIKSGGPYEFFCSFPGHSAVMKGTIGVQ